MSDYGIPTKGLGLVFFLALAGAAAIVYAVAKGLLWLIHHVRFI